MATHEELYAKACRVIPGGVDSPVRAFNAVGGTPIFVASGKGAYLTLADGRKVLDCCCSWGAMILGHADPGIVEAVSQAAARGTTFGIATPGEAELAERIGARIPFMDKGRLGNSGPEAGMTGLRLARRGAGGGPPATPGGPPRPPGRRGPPPPPGTQAPAGRGAA